MGNTENEQTSTSSTSSTAQNQRGEPFTTIVERCISRRGFLKYAAAGSAVVALGACGQQQPTAVVQPTTAPESAVATTAPETSAAATTAPESTAATTTSSLFEAIKPQPTDVDQIVIPAGYTVATLIRWGDPVVPGAPAFDFENQTPDAQNKQFGYNNDMLAFFPLPQGSEASDKGILVVNHEYPAPDLMFPGFDFEAPTKDQVDIEIASQGMSMVEIARDGSGAWSYLADSQYNRRITSATEMVITGPAAGHDLLKTNADPTGTKVIGTLNNCAGGWTPWGTYVGAEENFHQYFANGGMNEDETSKALYDRYGVPEGTSELKWETFYDRFDLAKEPNEVNRFGWLVEIDPYDTKSVAKKRTALGRFRHEAGTFVVAPNGKVVCYTGDDERFEYVYKFVTDGTYDKGNREANRDLLEAGTLYVAKFNDDGTGEWMPLVQGEGPLTADNGFETQADVLIKTRMAADALGATQMDRPEDIETNPVNGKVYIMLTNNTKREVGDTNAANPRAENAWGQVIEFAEDGNDYAATKFTWEILLLCGDPTDATVETSFAGYDKTKVSPIACPDNCTFDNKGNLWISTDGQSSTINYNDALHMVPVEGSERGHVQQFFSGVAGSETCGPLFTPDNTTLFIAIQHPGEGGTLDEPISTWPDGTTPPRPAVVVIQKDGGGPIV